MKLDRAWMAALAAVVSTAAAAVFALPVANAQAPSVLDVIENPTLAAARAMSDAAAEITNSRTEGNVEELESQLAAATAVAVRPGDDALTCEQLQVEAYALAEDPSIAAAGETIGASAQRQFNRAQAAAGVGAATLVTGAVATAGSPEARDVFILAQSASVLAQTAANSGADAEPMAAASGLMPLLGRLERVHALAEAKDCAFMRGGTSAADEGDEED